MLSALANSLNDPTTWPWDTILWIAVPLGAGLAKPILRWIAERRAEGWPSTVGRIDAVDADKASRWSMHVQGSKANVAEIHYSYRIDGNWYTGQYRRDFRGAKDADEFIRDLRGMTVKVHYQASKPSVSKLLNASVDALHLGRPPLSSRQITSGPTEDATVIGPKGIFWILLAIAALTVLFHR